MRRSTRLAAIPLLVGWLAGPSAGARPQTPAEFDAFRVLERKSDRIEPQARTAGALVQGEDFTNPLVIPGLPFEDENNTCAYRDDATPACTFLAGAPDVVYAFSPAADACVEVDLCDASYDTAVHVYDGGPDHPLACNDDAVCGVGSHLWGLELHAGHTYFVVVDGWSNACGHYVLRVAACPVPCPVPIPMGALPEGEPLCADGYYDAYNTGCNDVPYRFTNLTCGDLGVAVQGTYGTWIHGSEEWRDTDWYQIVLRRPTLLDYRLVGGAETQIAILDGSAGCPEYGLVCGSVFGGECDTLACEASVPPGTYWLFVAPRDYVGVPCGTPYSFTLQGYPCPPIAVEPSTWGQFKARFRD